MKCILLGTGTPRPNLDRAGPSQIVLAGEELFLIDCGRWVTHRLLKLGIPFQNIRNILFTHHHSDHNCCFYDILLTGWLAGRDIPVQVYGPGGTRAFVRHILSAHEYDIRVRRDHVEHLPKEGIKVQVLEREDGTVYERNGIKVSAFPVDHRPFSPAIGYRFDGEGRSIVISGDTRPCENVARMSHGVDVLIHEAYQERYQAELARHSVEFASRLKAIRGYHTSTVEAAAIAAGAKVKKLALTHLMPAPGEDEDDYIVEMKPIYPGPIVVGKDLMEL
jgi:ribonuclease Z